MMALLDLPDELLGIIASHLSAADTATLGAACKRTYKISSEPQLWKRFCTETWKFWEPRHGLAQKLGVPVAFTDWHCLYKERARIDRGASELFEKLLKTRVDRYERLREISLLRQDAKDLMLKMRDETSDTAEDVLARRYHASIAVNLIHRTLALGTWTMLKQGRHLEYEEALFAFDLYVLSCGHPTFDDVRDELNRLAQCLENEVAEFHSLTTRQKAKEIARFLRPRYLMRSVSEEGSFALRNNLISIVLFDEPHTCLPLHWVVIFCAIARRLGVDAKPVIGPDSFKVFTIIETPEGKAVAGRGKTVKPKTSPDFMYLDMSSGDDEIPMDQLQDELRRAGVSPDDHACYFSAASPLQVALGASHLLSRSAAQARRYQGTTTGQLTLDPELAWSCQLFSKAVLGDQVQQRSSVLNLVDQTHRCFPEDVWLFPQVMPMLGPIGVDNFYMADTPAPSVLGSAVYGARSIDCMKIPPEPRGSHTSKVRYRIGYHFQHRRYGYRAFIIGWDTTCDMDDYWIEQMRVDELPNGRDQPFYEVRVDDGSSRYVAQDNIQLSHDQPSLVLLQQAGKYFKRWDPGNGLFISNMREEYPDD